MSKYGSWDFALGLIKVDDLKPSDDVLELIEKEKDGKITTSDMIQILKDKYTKIRKREINE